MIFFFANTLHLKDNEEVFFFFSKRVSALTVVKQMLPTRCLFFEAIQVLLESDYASHDILLIFQDASITWPHPSHKMPLKLLSNFTQAGISAPNCLVNKGAQPQAKTKFLLCRGRHPLRRPSVKCLDRPIRQADVCPHTLV